MAPIGEDIKDVLMELGTSLTIFKLPASTVITEMCDQEFYATHSSEFLRLFFSSASLAYDTLLEVGDVVSANNIYHICTNIAPNLFENAAVDKTAVFYRCNCAGTLKRYEQNATFSSNYVKNRTWTEKFSNVRALQYESAAEEEHGIEEGIIAIATKGNTLYLPKYVTVKEGDRWFPSSSNANEFYRVAAIDIRRLPGVSICILADDKRE